MAESEARYASTIVIHRHHMNVLFESWFGRLLSPSMNPSATGATIYIGIRRSGIR